MYKKKIKKNLEFKLNNSATYQNFLKLICILVNIIINGLIWVTSRVMTQPTLLCIFRQQYQSGM